MNKFARCLILAGLVLLSSLAHATWSTDRDASAGYVTVATLASVVDEAVPFFIVYLSDLPSDFHMAMDTASDTDGKTIRLATSDGSTQLACYPVGINTGTNTGALFCLGTGMSDSVDTSYRIYVGNAALSMESVSGGYGRNTVFASYAGAYLPGMSGTDLTGNGRDLTTNHGTASSGYEGITAATYNGASQYDYYSGTLSFATFPMSLEGLAYSTDTSNTQTIIGCFYSSSNDDYGFMYFDGSSTDGIAADYKGPSGSTSSAATSTDYSASTWHYAASTRSGTTSGTATSYLDGGGAGTNSATVVATSFNRISIGATWINAGVFGRLSGRVAAALLSSSARSANFIATMKQNWDGNLYSVGSWSALGGCTSGSTGWVLFQTAAQTATSAVDWSAISDGLDDDADGATVVVNDSSAMLSETLKLTNPAYGVSIPTGATYTVTLRIKRAGTGAGGRRATDEVVKFIDDTGSLVGDNLADTVNVWPSSATTKDYIVTGVTFDGTEFTSAAGLALQVSGINQTANQTATEYVAWIKVDWTCPDSNAAKARGFFALAGG